MKHACVHNTLLMLCAILKQSDDGKEEEGGGEEEGEEEEEEEEVENDGDECGEQLRHPTGATMARLASCPVPVVLPPSPGFRECSR